MKKTTLFQRLAWIALFAGAALAAGCSSGVNPSNQISGVENAIQTAREHEAQIYATLELDQAEKKLAAAKKAIAEEEYAQAGMLLEQALVKAKRAETKSQAARAESQADAMRDSVDTLRKEVNH